MSKNKRAATQGETERIIGQVERILAAGEKLRAALQSEHWMDKATQATAHPTAAQRWLHTRAETDRAQAAYYAAIEECHRLAEHASPPRHGGPHRLGPTREKGKSTPASRPAEQLFVGV